MISINGKEYEITADIPFGLMEEMAIMGEDFSVMRKAFKEIMTPSPTDEEITNFRQSHVFLIMDLFAKEQKRLSIEFKKKLSLL
jgi:hypothetical protein